MGITVIRRREGFIFPKNPCQLGGAAVAYLSGNLFYGIVCAQKQILGGIQTLFVKIGQIRLTGTFFEQRTDIIGVKPYAVRQII